MAKFSFTGDKDPYRGITGCCLPQCPSMVYPAENCPQNVHGTFLPSGQSVFFPTRGRHLPKTFSNPSWSAHSAQFSKDSDLIGFHGVCQPWSNEPMAARDLVKNNFQGNIDIYADNHIDFSKRTMLPGTMNFPQRKSTFSVGV